MRIDVCHATSEVIVHRGLLCGESFSVSCDGAQAFADFRLWQCAVGGEVEEVFFFDVQCGKLVVQLLDQ